MATNESIIKAIQKIKATAQVSVSNDDINTIVWENGETPISKSDIEAKMVEIQAEYDAEQWKRDRKKEYPNHNDCIHALLDGGDTLTDLQAKRTATKNKYPKT